MQELNHIKFASLAFVSATAPHKTKQNYYHKQAIATKAPLLSHLSLPPLLSLYSLLGGERVVKSEHFSSITLTFFLLLYPLSFPRHLFPRLPV